MMKKPTVEVGVNALASVAAVTTLLAAEAYGGDWPDLEEARQTQLVLTATRILVEQIEWEGEPVLESQVLPFPRSGLKTRQGADVPTTGIPAEAQRACALLCLALNSSDVTADQAVVDLDIRRAGDTSFGPSPVRRVLPSAVVDAIPPDWIRGIRSGGALVGREPNQLSGWWADYGWGGDYLLPFGR